jgi:hypothetical protein
LNFPTKFPFPSLTIVAIDLSMSLNMAIKEWTLDEPNSYLDESIEWIKNQPYQILFQNSVQVELDVPNSVQVELDVPNSVQVELDVSNSDQVERY